MVVVFARYALHPSASLPLPTTLPAQNNGAGRTCCVACVGICMCMCMYVCPVHPCAYTHTHTHVSHPHAHRCCCLSVGSPLPPTSPLWLPLCHPTTQPSNHPSSIACQSVSASRFVFYYSRPAYTKMAAAPNAHTPTHEH